MEPETIDRLVRMAGGCTVFLDGVPRVYMVRGIPSLDPIGPEVPQPDELQVLAALGDRWPAVRFDLPDEFP